MTDRSALRNQIAEALEAADYRPDMRRGDLADAVMPVILPLGQTLAAHRDGAEDDVTRLTEERDGAYRERAHLVAWLAATHESVIAPAPDIDEDGWQILYLYSSAHGWQMSWHIHPRDAELFKDVTHVAADHPHAQWDGHTTEQKYNRIRSHVRVINMNDRLSKGVPPPCDDPMHVGYDTAGGHVHGPSAS